MEHTGTGAYRVGQIGLDATLARNKPYLNWDFRLHGTYTGSRLKIAAAT